MTTEQTVSNPEIDDRINNVEEVEAVVYEKESELKDVVNMVNDAKIVAEQLESIKNAVEVTVESGKANEQLGEITCIVLKDLFGRAGVSDKLMPSQESFKNPKTAAKALEISVEAINVNLESINNAITKADGLVKAKQVELEVAQEAFKDAAKDLLSRRAKAEDVKTITDAARRIKESADLDFRDPKDMESGKLNFYLTRKSNLEFMVKDSGISENLARDVGEDAQNIGKLTDALSSITNLLEKGDETPNIEPIVEKLKALDEVSFLGGIYFNVNRKASNASGVDMEKFIPVPVQKVSKSVGVGVGLPLLFLPFGGVAFISWSIGSIIGGGAANIGSKDAREKTEASLRRSAGKFEAPSNQYAKALETFAAQLDKFVKVATNPELKKSDNSEIRDMIRVGNGIASSVLKIAKKAERFYQKL